MNVLHSPVYIKTGHRMTRAISFWAVPHIPSPTPWPTCLLDPMPAKLLVSKWMHILHQLVPVALLLWRNGPSGDASQLEAVSSRSGADRHNASTLAHDGEMSENVVYISIYKTLMGWEETALILPRARLQTVSSASILSALPFGARSRIRVSFLRNRSFMGSVKKKRRRKIAKHKRRKQLKSQRHKTK